MRGSLVSLLAVANCNFNLTDSALQTHQVLLELSFLVFQDADLVLQFHVVLLLARKVVLKIFVNSVHKKISFV